MAKRAALTRTATASILFLLCLGVVLAFYVFISTGTHAQNNCDADLAGQIGAQESGICLVPLSVSASSENASEYNVPVLLMKPGSTATLTILYHNIVLEAPELIYPKLSSSSHPYALSIPSGRLMVTGVVFSTGTLLFQNGTWSIYKYDITASSNSSGYYAILPPFYYGFYPALVVSANDSINASMLSTWGFSGTIESGEFILIATFVGTSNLYIENATVPQIQVCSNEACSIIKHSGL